MIDNLKEQFDAIAERVGATRPTTPTPQHTTPEVTVTSRPHTTSQFGHPGARRTVIVDDDTEGGLTRLETTAEYLNRLSASTLTAHSREIGRGEWATLHLRWLYAKPRVIGMAWIEASVTGTFGYWHLGERCSLASEAQLILPLEGQPVDVVTSLRPHDWHDQCEAAVDALIATVARHAAAQTR